MAHWIVGDVHGCWHSLQELLARIDWRPKKDRLWLVGDLVNKGTGSLEVLRWAAANEGRVVSVMGNHDLHLLARAQGCAPKRGGDTLDDVLAAPDRRKLLKWLRRRPFLVERKGVVMVHAGMLPTWSLKKAARHARRCEAFMRRGSRSIRRLLREGRRPVKAGVGAVSKVAFPAAVFTTVRMVDLQGDPVFGFDGGPRDAPDRTKPWFDQAKVLRKADLVVFGHWANLGYWSNGRVVCLDMGCVYGGNLCALRVDDRTTVAVRCARQDRP